MENLNQQLVEQNVKIESQENELTSKRKELEELRSEESKLEAILESNKREIDSASKTIGDTQLEISQLGTKLIEMEEYERRLNDGINDINYALSNNDIMKINTLLPRTITPPLIESQNTDHNNRFESNDPFKQTQAEFTADPFAGEDPFKEGIFFY